MARLIWTMLSLIVAGSALAQTSADEAMRHAGQYPTAQPPKAVLLSEQDVTGFIEAATELRRLGIETDLATRSRAKPGLPEALATNAKAQGILERNGFSTERFSQVASSIGLAMAALGTKEKPGSLDKARAGQAEAMARMKQQLSPAQYEMMRKQMEMASGALESLERQPAQNLELVAKHRDALNAISSAH